MKPPWAFAWASKSSRPAPHHSQATGTDGPLPVQTCLVTALRRTRARIIPLLTTALIAQGVTIALAGPAIAALFDLALKAAGVARITDQNLLVVLGNPWAVVWLLLLAGTALTAVTLQLITLAILAHRQQCGLGFGLRPVAAELGGTLRRVLNYQVPLLMVYAFVIMPLGGFGLFSTITRDISIPAFISGEMMKAPASFLLYSALIAAMVFLNIRLILVFPLLVIDRATVWRAMRGSFSATRGQFWRTTALLVLVWAATAVGTAVLVEAVSLAAAVVGQFVPATSLALTASVGYGVGAVGSVLLLSLALVVIVQALTALHEQGQAAALRPVGDRISGDPFSRRHRSTVRRDGRKLPRPVGIAVAGALVSAVALTSGAAVPSEADGWPARGSTAVIGHRGFVGGGVENTIGALEAAAAVKPDYVEIDAQQTRDGRFILSHDVNLWLVSGRNVNTYELSLEEAENITVSVGGFTDTMVSLTDYVQRAEELGVTLLIELKTHGHETADVVDKFLAALDAIGSTGKHIYHSLNAEVVEELNAQRPELTVGRTVAVSMGDLTQLEGDFLLVEQTFFTEELSQYAREQDKKVLVWTVNDEEAIRKFMSIPVDGIVTDRPELAQQVRAALEAEQGSIERLRDRLHRFTAF